MVTDNDDDDDDDDDTASPINLLSIHPFCLRMRIFLFFLMVVCKVSKDDAALSHAAILCCAVQCSAVRTMHSHSPQSDPHG